MWKTKEEWINLFREEGDRLLVQVNNTDKNTKDKAGDINKGIKRFRNNKTEELEIKSNNKNWNDSDTLNELLLLTYASYVIMLEFRNKVWPYEYMAFARRIGELWEPFCKMPFENSVKTLSLIEAPNFDVVQEQLKNESLIFIDNLEISEEMKTKLKFFYTIPWTLVDSGGIKLGLDLHFAQNAINYNCDFKSGFSSNEKGNTNRLLLVASIYKSLGENEKTLLFVRQKEDENNHYLQTLKNSPYWDVYCADECYAAICRFTGFDMRLWLNTNVDWINDISDEFKKHLVSNNLVKYLTW